MSDATDRLIIDDMHDRDTARNGCHWELFTDQVMGGVSRGTLTHETVMGRPARRMRGDVRLENNGGFVQMSLDLKADGGAFDASAFDAVAIDVCGNGQDYNVHLRTTNTLRPWQSYRQSFHAGSTWRTITLPFASFAGHRIAAPFEPAHLRRISIAAIGRAFNADLAIATLTLVRLA